jgi:hypothetical protein
MSWARSGVSVTTVGVVLVLVLLDVVIQHKGARRREVKVVRITYRKFGLDGPRTGSETGNEPSISDQNPSGLPESRTSSCVGPGQDADRDFAHTRSITLK